MAIGQPAKAEVTTGQFLPSANVLSFEIKRASA